MRCIFTVLMLSFSLLSSSQIDFYLADYSIMEERNYALISWTTSSGFTCEDITIEHATDTTAFSTVYTYPGICGAENKEEKYTYLFRDIVYNQVNYFRLNLGKFGISRVLEIQLVSLEGLKPKVYPNPANANSVILFKNEDRDIATITVFNSNGQEMSVPLTTQRNEVQMSDLLITTPGIYYYTVQINGIITRGKFIFL